MPTIIVETALSAPVELGFDAARDIDLHCRAVAHTRERAVAGVMSGLIGLGESVTFEGVHFGVRQRFTARVTELVRPEYFVDEMTQGAFQSLRHLHEFVPQSRSTPMRDNIKWRSPSGVPGVIADTLFLKRNLQAFISKRVFQLKLAIETG